MKRSIIALTLIAVLGLITIPAFSQESKEPATPAPAVAAEAANEAITQPEEMSIYGEVKSTDETTNSIKLQYYDYDNDEEKTVAIEIDKDTKMENAASLKDIKQGDWVDAVYLMKEKSNIAKSIIVEKEEEEALPAAMPQDNKAVDQPAETPATE